MGFGIIALVTSKKINEPLSLFLRQVKRSIIYIINPISGTRSKTYLWKKIEEKTERKNIPYQIFSSVSDGDYSFLHSIIQEKNITDVVVAGGDGTLSQVVASLKNFNLNFGIIPCGSGNGLALAAKISTNFSKAIDTVLTNNASFIDAFFVNNQFACMLCGLGFDAKIAKDFAGNPNRGLMTYLKLCMKNFWKMKPHPFEIQTGGDSLKTNAYFISIANSNQFGNHFTIAPKASLSDGLLDIVIVLNQNKITLIIQLLKQLVGWNKLQSTISLQNKKGIVYFQTNKLTIRNSSFAPLHIDGEPIETYKLLTVEIKKNYFKLIQPALPQ